MKFALMQQPSHMYNAFILQGLTLSAGCYIFTNLMFKAVNKFIEECVFHETCSHCLLII